MKTILRLTFSVAALGLTLALVGCGGTPRPRSYDFTIRNSGVNAPVQVDVIGVNAAEAEQWTSYSMTKYFQPQDAFRAAAADRKYTLQFRPGETREITLFRDAKKDATTAAYWRKWKDSGATQLFILADFPGISDSPGAADRRRLILPLTPDRWADPNAPIVVTVQGDSLVPVTPVLPPKQ